MICSHRISLIGVVHVGHNIYAFLELYTTVYVIYIYHSYQTIFYLKVWFENVFKCYLIMCHFCSRHQRSLVFRWDAQLSFSINTISFVCRHRVLMTTSWRLLGVDGIYMRKFKSAMEKVYIWYINMWYIYRERYMQSENVAGTFRLISPLFLNYFHRGVQNIVSFFWLMISSISTLII